MKPHEPMLRYIRRNVVRPDHLPYFYESYGLLFNAADGAACPMGLLSCSNLLSPFHRSHFAKTLPVELTSSKLRSFAVWWDRKKDPKRAVESIWGKEK